MDLKICRICLRTQLKVFKFDRFHLKSYYEEMLAFKVDDNDGLPHYFCYECAAILQKFHKFKEKCFNGQRTLKELLGKGPITYEAVNEIDRKILNLHSSIDILTINKNVFVDTVMQDMDENTEPFNILAVPKIENIELEIDFSDNDIADSSISPKVDVTDIPNIVLNVKKETQNQIENVDTELLQERKKRRAVRRKNQIKNVDTELLQERKKRQAEWRKNQIKNVDTELLQERKRRRAEWRKKVAEEKKLKKEKKITKPMQLVETGNWKKVTLSEEEAMKEFRARADHPTYIAATYKCVDCLTGFSKEDMLKRHLKLRHSKSLGNIVCHFCHMRFKWDCYLKRHIVRHYDRYECLRCNRVCPLLGTALMHDESHRGVKKKCEYCQEEFRHASTYYTHMRTHRSKHICTACGVSFVSELGLNMHRRRKHLAELEDLESPDDDDEGAKTFCARCDIRFETRKAYEEHLFHSAMHVEDTQQAKDKLTPPRKLLDRKVRAKITMAMKLQSMDDHFIPSELAKEMRAKHPKKPTDCYQCGKHFDTQGACLKHHLKEHPRTSFFHPNKRHVCEICGASLAPGSLAAHQNKHSREKLYTCSICGKQFSASCSLKCHLVTHTGEKPFGCSLCDKRFTQSGSMKLHYRTFHLKQPYPKRNRRPKNLEEQEEDP